MNQSREIIQSFHTLVDMLRDRNMYEDVSEIVNFRDKEIEEISMNSRPVFPIEFATCNIRVIYNMHPKFKVNDVKKLLDHPGIVILISREKPGTLALKGIEEAASNIEVFDINELQFNVAKHSLVPKHESIRDEKTINAIIKASLVKTKFQLPLILSTDVMARYLALKPGELVKITRISPSAGEATTYRCCVKAG